jgi:hypothetical protein
VLGTTSMLASRSCTVWHAEGEAHRNPHSRLGRRAGGAGEQLPSRRALDSLRGARRPGRRVRVVLRRRACSDHSDSTGLRTPSSRTRAVRIRASQAVTSERLRSVDSFVPVDDSTELGARRRYTLNARPKGMRGRLRWFTPSRPARGLNTAKIGRGHGGSTQPIRC